MRFRAYAIAVFGATLLSADALRLDTYGEEDKKDAGAAGGKEIKLSPMGGDCHCVNLTKAAQTDTEPEADQVVTQLPVTVNGKDPCCEDKRPVAEKVKESIAYQDKICKEVQDVFNPAKPAEEKKA